MLDLARALAEPLKTATGDPFMVDAVSAIDRTKKRNVIALDSARSPRVRLRSLTALRCWRQASFPKRVFSLRLHEDYWSLA